MINGDEFVKEASAEFQKESPDLAKAYALLEQAADLDHPEAVYAIGSWYLHGEYVKRSRKKAVAYLERAADLGYLGAYMELAICYETGEGTKKSDRKAFRQYLRGALAGNDECFYEVGRCFYYGIGVAQDRKVSLIWFDESEKRGITE